MINTSDYSAQCGFEVNDEVLAVMTRSDHARDAYFRAVASDRKQANRFQWSMVIGAVVVVFGSLIIWMSRTSRSIVALKAGH